MVEREAQNQNQPLGLHRKFPAKKRAISGYWRCKLDIKHQALRTNKQAEMLTRDAQVLMDVSPRRRTSSRPSECGAGAQLVARRNHKHFY